MIPRNNRERFLYAAEPVAHAFLFIILGAIVVGLLYGAAWGILSFFIFIVSVWAVAYWMLGWSL